MSQLKEGKVSPFVLQKFFSSLPEDRSVIVGPGIGKDAAVVSIEENLIAIKTDPITFTSENLGWYVVNINANDIACMGAEPCWFLVNLILPPGEKKQFLQTFFDQLSQSCKELGISLVGGHTEVTPAVKRPIAVGCMVGKLKVGKVVTNSDARVGDVVLLTKGVAIEGTHVIYQEKKEDLKNKIPLEDIKKIENFLKDPGISIVKEAKIALKNFRVHCLHDPTEGGLIAGVWEIAKASKVGIIVEEKKVPILRETKIICERFNIDPLALLASGALLIVTEEKESEKLISLYKKEKIRCEKIGKVLPEKEGVIIVRRGGRKENILEPPEDELTKLF